MPSTSDPMRYFAVIGFLLLGVSNRHSMSAKLGQGIESVYLQEII